MAHHAGELSGNPGWHPCWTPWEKGAKKRMTPARFRYDDSCGSPRHATLTSLALSWRSQCATFSGITRTTCMARAAADDT